MQVGGFGNGGEAHESTWDRAKKLTLSSCSEFQWTTSNPDNSFVEDGKLYIVPTLTVSGRICSKYISDQVFTFFSFFSFFSSWQSDEIGVNAVTNGYVVNLTRDGTCTSTTAKDCVIFSNNTLSNISIIPPIQSARLTTKFSKSIRFGRVEVKAKMPTGDWIWPASGSITLFVL